MQRCRVGRVFTATMQTRSPREWSEGRKKRTLLRGLNCRVFYQFKACELKWASRGAVRHRK